MELTKSKLNQILKKYKHKLEQHDKEWEEICQKYRKKSTENEILSPTIYDHESHSSKGSQLFRELVNEFEKYEVFPKKKNKKI